MGPDVSCVDSLGTMSVAIILVFHACSCGTVSVIAAGSVSLIMCGAASGVCVLAWSGGAILVRVIFGNAPGVLRQVMHW